MNFIIHANETVVLFFYFLKEIFNYVKLKPDLQQDILVKRKVKKFCIFFFFHPYTSYKKKGHVDGCRRKNCKFVILNAACHVPIRTYHASIWVARG